MARVSLYGYESLRPGSARLARLRLEEPVVLVPGDRFVLRQPAPVATIGGGCILDCHPEARQRKATALAWLEQVSRAAIPEQLVMRVKRRGAGGIHIQALAREAGLTADQTGWHLESAIQAAEVAIIGADLLVSRGGLNDEQTPAIHRLGGPAQKSAASRINSSSSGNKTTLAPEVIGEAYEAAGLAPPTVPELATRFGVKEADMRLLITLLQRQKTIVRMGSDDLFMHARALDGLAARMASLRGKAIDVAGFKQLTGLSRKYAIPLLEYLDHARITRKQGDQRIVL